MHSCPPAQVPALERSVLLRARLGPVDGLGMGPVVGQGTPAATCGPPGTGITSKLPSKVPWAQQAFSSSRTAAAQEALPVLPDMQSPPRGVFPAIPAQDAAGEAEPRLCIPGMGEGQLEPVARSTI